MEEHQRKSGIRHAFFAIDIPPFGLQLADAHAWLHLYCWDGGKTWVVEGEPEAGAKTFSDATGKVAQMRVDEMKPGVRISELQTKGRDIYRKEGVPENVAFEMAQRYAREIVPSFSATAYFSVGMRLARWLGKSLYRIRVGAFDREALESIDDDATIALETSGS